MFLTTSYKLFCCLLNLKCLCPLDTFKIFFLSFAVRALYGYLCIYPFWVFEVFLISMLLIYPNLGNFSPLFVQILFLIHSFFSLSRTPITHILDHLTLSPIWLRLYTLVLIIFSLSVLHIDLYYYWSLNITDIYSSWMLLSPLPIFSSAINAIQWYFFILDILCLL